MKIVIGSKNSAKMTAVEKAFSIWEDAVFFSVDAPSNVSEQPFSDEETVKGAINRGNAALQKYAEADIAIGLEGGVQETPYGLCLINWGALVSRNSTPIIAGGARILLPEEITIRLRRGEELGPVMDEFANKQNVRKHEGAIGIFTNNIVNRVEMFTHVASLLAGQYQYNIMHNHGSEQ